MEERNTEKKKTSGTPNCLLRMMRNVAVVKWKLAIAMIAVVLVMIMVAVVVGQCSSSDEKHPEIVIEDTPILIEDIRPKGELYVCTSLVEDYTIERRTEMHLGILPEKHSCIQILRQKISYRIDLDKVCYVPDTLNVMIVEMPPVEYTASTQSSPFISDDEDYWIKELPNTNGLKAKVERQIRRRFDTDANRKKAEQYAEEALSELLGKLGYEARFKPRVERKLE